MSELHGLIMNVRVPSDIQYDLFESKILAYKHGHKDARHAAAELSLDASRLIEDLKAELAGLRTGFDAQNEVIAELRKDAERYRWLKSRQIEVPTIGPDLANWEDDVGWSIRGNEADTAIDAAMGKGGNDGT